jgi:hypothetical protein
MKHLLNKIICTLTSHKWNEVGNYTLIHMRIHRCSRCGKISARLV